MKNFLSSVCNETIREKIPVSNNHAENGFSVAVRLHPSFLSNLSLSMLTRTQPRRCVVSEGSSLCPAGAPRMQRLEPSLTTHRTQRLEPSLTLLLIHSS